ncbi:MFS transporter [Sphingomonas sp. MMS24-J13]|uniref:MFS transporter n=1 Tax=Sphingomonas sp. MMS24-J13 TaxID=3238686 RepID=UPI00384F0D54
MRDRVVAALACLQPGIDPVFLVLLSGNPAIPLSSHGLIVSASQLGMMLGAVFYWRLPGRIGRGRAALVAAAALATSLMTAFADTVAVLVALRALYGLGTGILYTRAASAAAARNAPQAFGTIFLMQLLLSSLVAAVLPWLAGQAGPAIGLAALAIGPATILILLALSRGPEAQARPRFAATTRATDKAGSIAAAAALFLFICATMMIWSHVGAAAMEAGLDDGEIGWGVAIGSLSGAVPAIASSYLRSRLPLLIGAGASALAMISPLLFGGVMDVVTFTILMVLFNVGSTYVIIRCSALAVELNPTGFMRRAASAMHPAGMIAGPMIGFIAMRFNGPVGLIDMAVVAVSAAMVALTMARSNAARWRLLKA